MRPPRRGGHGANLALAVVAVVGVAAAVGAGSWAGAHPSTSPPGERGYALDRLGLRLHARAAYRAAVDADPHDLKSRYRYLSTFGLLDRDVVPLARAMRDAAPGSAPAVFGLGYAHVRLRQMRKARPFIERAIAMDPELPYARAILGEIALYDDDRAAALRDYAADIERNPTFVLPYGRIAEIHSEAGRHADALAVLRQGLGRVDEPWRFYKSLYREHFLAGEYAESLKYFAWIHLPTQYPALGITLAIGTLGFWLWALRATGATQGLGAGRGALWVAVGFASVVPARLGYLFANHWIPVDWVEALWYEPFHHFAVTGLIEEGAKLAPVALAVALARPSNDARPAMARGAAVALGFSFYENYLYFVGQGPQSIGDRFFQSVLLHVSCTGLAAFGVARARATGRPSLALWGAAAAVAGHGGYNGLVGLHHGLGALALIALGLVGYGFHERLFRERLLAGVARPGLVGANARIFAGAATAVFFFVPTFVFLAHGLTEGLIFAFTSVTPVALVGALYLALAHHDYALARIRRLAWRRRWDALAAECAVVQAAVPRERRGGVALRWAYARWALGDAEGALAVAEGVECPGLDLQLLMARIRAEQGSLPAAAEGVDDPLARAYRGVVEAIDALARGEIAGAQARASTCRAEIEKLRRRATANRTIWERVPRALLGWGENRLLALGVEACGLARMEQWDAARALLDAHLGAARWVEGSSRVYVQWARARLRAHQGDHAGSEAARREALKAHFGRPIPFLAETDYHSGGSGGSLSVPDESVQDRTARL